MGGSKQQELGARASSVGESTTVVDEMKKRQQYTFKTPRYYGVAGLGGFYVQESRRISARHGVPCLKTGMPRWHSSWGGGTILRLGHFATLRGTDVLEVGLGD